MYGGWLPRKPNRSYRALTRLVPAQNHTSIAFCQNKWQGQPRVGGRGVALASDQEGACLETGDRLFTAGSEAGYTPCALFLRVDFTDWSINQSV